MIIYNQLSNTFEFDENKLKNLDYKSGNNVESSLEIANNHLFTQSIQKKNYYIFKNFVSKEIALKLQNYLVKTQVKNCFINTKDNSHRLFFYLNSPLFYPSFIKSLIMKCMIIKNMIFVHHNFYQNYCMFFNINPNHYEVVAQNQLLHSWQAAYWYKNGCKFDKHIDSYGELACFLILSKKGTDYLQGGISINYDDGTKKSLDDEYDYGDLVFLDQSKVYHEVDEIKHSKEQIGRLQLYIPTIPPNYMQKTLFYENYEHQPFFTTANINYFEKLKTQFMTYIQKPVIHYSRVDGKLEDCNL